MTRYRVATAPSSLVASGAMFLLAASGAFAAQDVPIVQPGAPGQKATKLTAQQAIKLADASYTVDDATFMRDMIHHHDQAVQMAEMVKDRTNLPELVALAGRINASQADEIAFMQSWLRERGLNVPEASMHRGMDMKGTMEGMASPADLARLMSSSGTDFDRLFLGLMIAHHDGALKMVDALVKKEGSAYDPAAVPVHERREDRTEGRDRPHERAPGHARHRPPRGARGRLQGRRTGGEAPRAGGGVGQAHRLLRPEQRRRHAATQAQEEGRRGQGGTAGPGRRPGQ